MLCLSYTLRCSACTYQCRSAFPFNPTGSKTLYDNWSEAVERYGPLPCLGHRSGTTYSYLSFAVGAQSVGAGFDKETLV